MTRRLYTSPYSQERLTKTAYNRPAYYLLGSHHLTSSNTNPFPRLCALIAYYPLTSTDQWTRDSHVDELSLPQGPACTSTASIFTPGPNTTYLPIQIHLPGHEAKTTTLWPWISLNPSEGDTTYKKRHRCYVYAYPDAKAGFAERNIDPERNKELHDQDRVSSRLAWSRTLGCLRRAFGVGGNWAVVDIETVWEEYWRRVLGDLERRRVGEDAGEQGEGPGKEQDEERSGAALEMMVSRGRRHDGSFLGKMDLHENEGPSVECVPTRAGGEFLLFCCWHSSKLTNDYRIKHAYTEILLRRHIHPQRPTRPTHPTSLANSGRRPNSRRDIVLVSPHCRSTLAITRRVAHRPRDPGGHCGCG